MTTGFDLKPPIETFFVDLAGTAAAGVPTAHASLTAAPAFEGEKLLAEAGESQKETIERIRDRSGFV